jgi:minor histocompatibility antigen H13
MKQKDAAMFPIFASFSLFGLYVAFKFLPKDWINYIMKIYFVCIGAFVVGATVAQAILTFVPKSNHAYWETVLLEFDLPKVKIPIISDLFGKKEEPKSQSTNGGTNGTPPKVPPKDVVIHRSDLMGLPFGALTVVLYWLTNHWSFTNIMGISFSIQAIAFLNLGTFLNGLILLSGLFVYDIFWVFGTEVMVSVATKFDVPIKVLFPRADGKPNAMLGLGDIVIPGIFIAMMLRVDLHLDILAKKLDLKKVHKYIPQPKLYFLTCLASYIVGMSVTLGVMFWFNHAQPALLYLVPANLLSVLGLGLAKGQLPMLMKYTEEDEKIEVEQAKNAEKPVKAE